MESIRGIHQLGSENNWCTWQIMVTRQNEFLLMNLTNVLVGIVTRKHEQWQMLNTSREDLLWIQIIWLKFFSNLAFYATKELLFLGHVVWWDLKRKESNFREQFAQQSLKSVGIPFDFASRFRSNHIMRTTSNSNMDEIKIIPKYLRRLTIL